MRITKLSITNFRSIKKAQNIELSDMTVLIGKNNEGKSNFLAALTICLNSVIRGYSRRFFREFGDYKYDWKRDFPVSLQQTKSIKKFTTIAIELSLSSKDIINCKKEVGLNLPPVIQITTRFGKNGDVTINISDKSIEAKFTQFQRFLYDNISLIYIPAVRTPEQAKRVINDSIYSALSSIKSDNKYKRAKQTIARLQKPILDQISKSIKAQLAEFLPTIKNVTIELEDESDEFLRWHSSFDIIINDGNQTSIDYKGDGVKSLAALGILKNSKKVKELSIVAIEEPESHLHPGAIKQLKQIIQSLENTNQIVLTTHSPLFINKHHIASNIVIDDKIAKNAQTISEIRDILGVVVDDNLSKAKYVIFVEGPSDKRVLTAVLSVKNKTIKQALESGDLVIDILHGASKLSQMFEYARTNLCDPYVILDNDTEGRAAVESAIARDIVKNTDYILLKCRNKPESELEDMIDQNLYKAAILTEFGVDISKRYPSLKTQKLKWSQKMQKIFEINGKLFDDDIEMQLKSLVAKCVEQKPRSAILDINKPIINNIIISIKKLIEK